MDKSMNMPIFGLMFWGVVMYVLCMPKKTLPHYVMLLWALFVSIAGITTIPPFNIKLNFYLKIFVASGSYFMIMYVFWAFHKEVKRLLTNQNTDTIEFENKEKI